MAKEEKVNPEEENTVEETTAQNTQPVDAANSDAEEQQDEVAEVEQLNEQIKIEKDKFLRLFAEFENFKRRTAKERIELYKTAGEGVLKDMLPVLDDFDRGMVEINKCSDEQLVTGVQLISGKLRSVLKAKGLEEMEVEQGTAFDADVHDAITQIPAPNDDMKGKIVDVVEKGYKLGDKIIRHPKVVVGK